MPFEEGNRYPKPSGLSNIHFVDIDDDERELESERYEEFLEVSGLAFDDGHPVDEATPTDATTCRWGLWRRRVEEPPVDDEREPTSNETQYIRANQPH